MPPPASRAAIVGIAGPTLSPDERALFAAHPPAGIILFARNVETPDQLRRLNAEIAALLGPDTIRMIDQEGGRVARLRPPHWQSHPPAAEFGTLYETDPAAAIAAARRTGTAIGQECAEAGFTVVNAPVLDLRIQGAHDVIGDRAFSASPAIVATLGRAMAAGLAEAGIQPVAKHIPGHGRALADSHAELPRLAHGTDADLAPFVANTAIGWAMTAHIVYEDWDTLLPATLSPTIIQSIIRDRCGFAGVLVSDDLTMRALAGPPATLAAQSLAAGCDLVLHCSGILEETAALLPACPPITPQSQGRLQTARTRLLSADCRLPTDD